MSDVERNQQPSAEDQWIAKYREAVSRGTAPAARHSKILAFFSGLNRFARSFIRHSGATSAPPSLERLSDEHKSPDGYNQVRPFEVPDPKPMHPATAEEEKRSQKAG